MTDKLRRAAPYLLLLAALLVPLINPVGYVGGGADDIHYLDAARCWAASGEPCIPQSHWQSRWPAIAPIALFTGLFGETRATVAIGPLLAWAACILLVAALGRAWFDRTTGVLAAVLLASTPVVAQPALQPGVDTTELALQLAALLVASLAYERQSAVLSVVAGALAAVAVQARDTSIIFCGAAALAWLLLDRDRRRVLLWAIAGWAGALLAEAAAYAVATGDPLYRYRLALAHVTVPSSELASDVDTSRSPLFNPDYIQGWRPASGIRLWWPIDPWLNLLASPVIGMLLCGLLIVLPFGWRALPGGWRKSSKAMLLLSLLISAALIYALAVDPKPPMFFALAAAAALALAATTVAAWRAGKGLVPAVVAALVVAGGAFALSRTVNTHELERRAEGWIAAHRGDVEIEQKTRTTLALLPDARALPGVGSGKRFVIAAAKTGCGTFGLTVVDRAGDPLTGQLCLLRRN